MLRMQSVSSCATAPDNTPPPGRRQDAMFRAQTLSFGLGEDWRMEWTASRVSDFRIRMRGTWGGGKGLEVMVGSAAEELAVGDD